MVGKDLIMATLFGSGGGSSGSGGGGGSSSGVSPKEVNFYDYDGTCVHAYTVAEAQALSELPAGPEHPGLVFQGWNWSLEGVKGLTRAMNIGAMYTTDDGTTRLYITLQEGRTSPMLGVGVNGTVTVDWGDGTEPDVLTGTSVSTTVWTPNHAYAAPGDYVIRLTVDGEMAFVGSSSLKACIVRYDNSQDKRNEVYQTALKKVEIGNAVVALNDYSFVACNGIASVTIPEGVTTIGSDVFRALAEIEHISFPIGISKTGTSLFYAAGIKTVSWPETMTNVGNSAMQQCNRLKHAIIPGKETSIGSSMFSSCGNLTSVDVQEGVISINGSAFSSSYSIASVKMPKSLESISSYAFYSCYGLGIVDFTACTSVPTLAATNAFSGIPADCEIRVPAALYDEWIAATNWSTYADYIKAY